MCSQHCNIKWIILSIEQPPSSHKNLMGKTKNRNNNINNSNLLEPELLGKMDSFDADKADGLDMDNSLFE
uniref:Uncharacterized protein n=1 Tax=Arion vulgaris TaxID=1028688 RepID=A0A0B7AIF2_9EUPU